MTFSSSQAPMFWISIRKTLDLPTLLVNYGALGLAPAAAAAAVFIPHLTREGEAPKLPLARRLAQGERACCWEGLGLQTPGQQGV